MSRRRVVAVVLAAVAVVLGACGGGGGSSTSAPAEPAISDPTAEALAYAPAGAAVLALVETDPAAGPGLELVELAQRLPGVDEIRRQALALVSDRLGLDAEVDLLPLAGAPLVLWSPDAVGTPSSAWVTASSEGLAAVLSSRVNSGQLTDAGAHRGFTLFSRPGGAYARRGPVLLSGPSPEAVRATIDLRQGRRGGWDARLVRERSVGLRPGALVTVLASAPVVLDRATPGLRRKVGALRATQRIALALVPEEDGLRLRLNASLNPEALASSDLPIAAGPEPPVVRGEGQVVVAVRDLAQTLAFARKTVDALDPERLKAVDGALEVLRSFARVDVENDVLGRLTGSATAFSEDGRTVTLNAEAADPKGLEDVLGRLGSLARFGGAIAGLTGADLGGLGVRREESGAQSLTKDDAPVASFGVFGDALVVSSDPAADLQLAADTPPGEKLARKGALYATATDDVLEDLLVDRLGLPAVARLALGPLGDPVLTARSETDTLRFELFLPVE